MSENSDMKRDTRIFIGKDGIEYETEEDRWLTDVLSVANGAISIAYTENGDVGVFLPNQTNAAGVGDTVMEAVRDAVSTQRKRS